VNGGRLVGVRLDRRPRLAYTSINSDPGGTTTSWSVCSGPVHGRTTPCQYVGHEVRLAFRLLVAAELNLCDEAYKLAGNVETPTSSPLLTEAQAANYLRVSQSTLRRWRRSGAGPRYFKLGAIIRYAVRDLNDFIATNSIEGVA
jgi:hypothetical protein